MISVIEKSDISILLERLSRKYSVINYKKDEIALSAKGHFFAPRENLFSFVFKQKKLSIPPKSKRKLLLFGLDLIDLGALDQLDEIMTRPKEDYFYLKQRENSVIVGLSEYSITVPVTVGDLILEKINENQYKAIPLTKIGREIVKNKLFKIEKNPKILNYPEEKKGLRELVKDSELLAEAVSWSWLKKHPIWDELEKNCLGCGICTYVCPICHCFSVEDEIKLDGSECSRCRSWDACTLNNFAKIAGGKNFRPNLKYRYYNWFYHKFVRAYKEYGKSQCVGCGRCQKYCPARIDIEKVLLEIIKDYQNEKSLSA
ncbi:MAG: 4Fe-4S dicluster domain-containing protein [bacterium]|nr:4Fe-4S dicluster domain-containing protein [bacterium]